MINRTPQCLESEQSTLGVCLIKREAVAIAAAILKEEDFYREHHRKIYKAILGLFSTNKLINIITISKELRRIGQLEECGGTDYLVALVEVCPSTANAETYARIVREKSLLRQH